MPSTLTGFMRRAAPRARGGFAPIWRCPAIEGDGKAHRSALAGGASNIERAAVPLDDVFDDRQPKAGTAAIADGYREFAA